MTWADRAFQHLAKVDASIPFDATIKQRRQALRKHAWSFHQGTSWGRKVWGAASRRYLIAHGMRVKNRKIINGPLLEMMGVKDV